MRVFKPRSIRGRPFARFGHGYGLQASAKQKQVLRREVAALRKETAAQGAELARLQRYEDYFHDSPVGAHTLDADGIILEVNQRWLKLLGYKLHEVVGRSIVDFVVEEQKENVRARIIARKAGESLPPKEAGRRYLTKNGEEIIGITFTREHPDAGGNLVAVQKSFLDATELEQRQEELRALQKAMLLDERQAALGRLTADISHMRKNQIAGLDGMIETLMASIHELQVLGKVFSALEASGRQIGHLGWQRAAALQRDIDIQLQALQDETRDMGIEVRGVLRQSRMDSGEFTVIPVAARMEKVCATLEPLARRQAIELQVSTRGVRPSDGILISPNEFSDVIRNLVTNGLEAFVEQGAAKRRVRVLARKIGQDKIRIEVSDNGPGIDAARLEELSGATGPIMSDKLGGTGLGLNSVRIIVKNVDGSWGIESEVGKGTTVWLEFDRMHYQEKSSGVSDVEQLSGSAAFRLAAQIEIWIVDDVAAALDAAATSLRGQGFGVQTFNSPTELINRFVGAGEQDRPDVVITDFQMTETQGDELIETLARDLGNSRVAFFINSGDEVPADGSALFGWMRTFDVGFIQKPSGIRDIGPKIIEKVFAGADPQALARIALPPPYPELADNPYRAFLGTIVHEVNNRLTALSGDIEAIETQHSKGGIPTAAFAKFREHFPSLQQDMARLSSFASLGEGLNGLASLEATDLAKIGTCAARVEEIWSFQKPAERHKLGLIATLYLEAGIRDAVTQIEQILGGSTISRANLRKISGCLERIERNNQAALLTHEAFPAELLEFKLFYELLPQLDSPA